jgi:hypothetical protein
MIGMGNLRIFLVFFVTVVLINIRDVQSDDDDNSIKLKRISVSKSFMRHMWTSPVQQFSLVESGILDAWKLNNIREDILRYYQDFKSKSINNHDERNGIPSDATISDMFYIEQQSSDLKYKQCLLNNNRGSCVSDRPKIFQQLSYVFLEAATAYLQENYLPLSTIIEDDTSSAKEVAVRTKIFAWTSLHANGTHHAPHHHVDSVISGVIYVNVPKTGTGDLIFYDPRGSLPPFGKTLHIAPKSGDLVLFPGYLVHSVEPTLSSNETRISISFNCYGSWEGVSDVNIAYVTEPLQQ